MKVEPIVCQIRRIAEHVLDSHNGAVDLDVLDAELGALRAIIRSEAIRREDKARAGRKAIAKLMGFEPEGAA